MERVGILIDKLKEQFASQVDSDNLLITAQMLLAELQQYKKSNPGRDSVSVMVPGMSGSSAPSISMTDSPVSKSVSKKREELSGWLFDMQTLAPAKEILELNDHLVGEEMQSLNDQLKQEETNVSAGFQETPIRDLKKAIGINDRYLFINELFRGDETMYERSLKTINGFAIFPEAQYWIQRELKVKLGWNDRSEIVDHFHQLVRRRFA